MVDKITSRSPVCSVVGHVDHGKSTILDYIRNSNIVSKEAGAITQAIGASIIPLDVIKKLCGSLLDTLKINITLPGLLFIDTPGHAAFTSLRKRGGNLADIAIVTIDINEGVKPQTEESIRILQTYKTPFIIALNKIDLIPGFRVEKGKSLMSSIASQTPEVQQKIDEQLYKIVGKVHELFGITCDRFDRVNDYTKNIVMIPCSAKEGVGIPELLMMLIGLAQRFLEKGLMLDVKGYAKGTILEVKEEIGLGITMDTIIYDGTLKIGDTIVIGSMGEPIVTKVKALFEPNPLSEMRDKKSKFKSVKQVVAATGVKLSAKDIDHVIAGMPLRSCLPNDVERVSEEIKKEVDEVLIETDGKGIIVKADSLGSLEALIKLLQENGVSIRRASVGNITRKDIVDAESNIDENPLSGAILGFNVKPEKDDAVKIITADIIYKLLDDFVEWKEQKTNEIKASELDNLTKPAKVEFLSGYVFRQNNPAVVGMEVLAGTLKVGANLMKDGQNLTSVKQIQSENKAVNSAEKGKQVAVSMPGVTVGRQIAEGDILYTMLSEDEFRKYKEYKDYLEGDVKATLKEIADIMRRKNPVWGV
jgi:translation initiation factor 5B